MRELLTAFWDWVDNRNIVHRLILFLTVGLTAKASLWGADYAWHSTRTGADVAMIVAAVTAPITALMKFVFDTYSEKRKADP